ncbi:MAG: hypothetical protein BGP12_04070 [Rhodospirillales bacterium 70-18]|nr:pilus assembly protein [Rhodospirillales bacterium]OJY64918.1 MAG: hypothetical protein BGP12_04070 [Rhodospirillales bacterium 70-18]
MRQLRRLRRLAGARRGSVTLEFVLASPALLLLLGFTIDYALLLRARVTLAGGVMSGVQYASVQGTSVTAGSLQSVVQQATGMSGITATVTGPACYCPSSYPVTLPATTSTCGSTCPADGSTARNYVRVVASYTYLPMMPGMSSIVATTLTESATAMLP